MAEFRDTGAMIAESKESPVIINKMNYAIIDYPDFEPIEGWEVVPFLDKYVHFDPAKISEIKIYKMIDDYLNCRNEDIYDNLES